MKSNLTQREVDNYGELSDEDVRKLLFALLKRLNLVIVEEATPDYRSLELREKTK